MGSYSYFKPAAQPSVPSWFKPGAVAATTKKVEQHTGRSFISGSGGTISSGAGVSRGSGGSAPARPAPITYSSSLLGQTFTSKDALQKAETQYKQQQAEIARQEQVKKSEDLRKTLTQKDFETRQFRASLMADDVSRTIPASQLLSQQDTRMITPPPPSTRTIKDRYKIAEATRQPGWMRTRLAYGKLGQTTGTFSLLGDYDEKKQAELEKDIEKKTGEIEARQERYEKAKKEATRDDEKLQEDLKLLDERIKKTTTYWQERDIEPDKPGITLSEEDYKIYKTQTIPLLERYQKQADDLKYKIDVRKSKLQTVESLGFDVRWRQKDFEDKYGEVFSAADDFEKSRKELSGYGLDAEKIRGYDIDKAEYDYSPFQKGNLDLVASGGLAFSTITGKKEELTEPVLRTQKDIDTLKTFGGQRAYRETLLKPFDPIDAGSRIASSAMVVGGIGAVGGSAIGSGIPLIGTGIGAVSGFVVGAKAGAVGGIADVVASETVGRVYGDEKIGRTAGFVAGIVGTVGASKYFMGKEFAKRTVVKTLKPTIAQQVLEQRVVEGKIVTGKGLVKGQIIQPYEIKVLASQGKIDKFIAKGVSKLTGKPPKTVLKTITREQKFIVEQELDFIAKQGLTVYPSGDLAATSKLPVIGGKKTFFIAESIAPTTKIIETTKTSPFREKLASFIIPGKTKGLAAQDGTKFQNFWIDKPKTVTQKIASRVRGEKFVDDSYFRDMGFYQPVYQTRDGRVLTFVDKVSTVSTPRGIQITRMVDLKDGKEFLGTSGFWDFGKKLTATQFVGKRLPEILKPSGSKILSITGEKPLALPGIVTGKGVTSMSFAEASKQLTQQKALSVVASGQLKQVSLGIQKDVSARSLGIVAPGYLKSSYGGGIVLAKAGRIRGYDGAVDYTDVGVDSVGTVSRPASLSTPSVGGLTSIDFKERVDVGVKDVFVDRTKVFQPYKVFSPTISKVVVGQKLGYDKVDRFRVDGKIVDRLDTSQDTRLVDRLGLGQGTIMQVGQVTMQDTRLVDRLSLVDRLDTPRPVIDFKIKISPPIPPPIVGGGLPGFGRFDVGFGVPKQPRRRKAGRVSPLFAIKSDFYRKFVTGEKDLLVSKENVALVKGLRARKGSLLAFIPTKELLAKKKKSRKSFWEDSGWLKKFGL